MAASSTLSAAPAEIEVSFSSPSTRWTAQGRVDLGGHRYDMTARATLVRDPTLEQGWAIIGLEKGVFWTSLGRGRDRCYIDGFLPGGSFGGALSTERAMGLIEAYVRLLEDATAARTVDGSYLVGLGRIDVGDARYLERDAGGFGGRLKGRIIPPDGPVAVEIDADGRLASLALDLPAVHPEQRYGIEPEVPRTPEASHLEVKLSGYGADPIEAPDCAGIE